MDAQERKIQLLQIELEQRNVQLQDIQNTCEDYRQRNTELEKRIEEIRSALKDERREDQISRFIDIIELLAKNNHREGTAANDWRQSHLGELDLVRTIEEFHEAELEKCNNPLDSGSPDCRVIKNEPEAPLDADSSLDDLTKFWRLKSYALTELIDAKQSTRRREIEDVLPPVLADRLETPWPKLLEEQKKTVERLLNDWNLFSADWYRKNCWESRGLTDEQARAHFIEEGILRGHDPHPIFSNYWLIRQGVGDDNKPPLVEYAESKPIVDPHPLFNCQFYQGRYPDVVATNSHPLEHYLKYGASEQRQPHICFEPAWYGKTRKAKQRLDLLSDYLQSPSSYRIDPNPFFDAGKYLDQLPRLVTRGINPLVHYLIVGEQDGFAPSNLFEPTYYYDRNSDVREAGVSALMHFMNYGDAELRQVHPLFDHTFYRSIAEPIFGTIPQPYRHYIVEGARKGLPANSHIQPAKNFHQSAESGIDYSIGGIMTGWDTNNNRLDKRKPAVERRVEVQSQAVRIEVNQNLLQYVDQECGERTTSKVKEILGILVDIEQQAEHADELIGGLIHRLDSSAKLIKRVATPDVTVIIPVHNQVAYTAACLIMILEEAIECSFEIIIADDCSTDQTLNMTFDEDSPLRVIRHENNLGFLLNCNAAAAAAEGRYIAFLNNDTLPLPGWLDTLLVLMRTDSRIGMVGSKLINTDGTLQEAGGIIWRDGSAWNFGRGSEPNRSAFNYVKDVDYISGAAILISRQLWQELGGFDTYFTPAYCEDSDLAFRVRRHGSRVVFQPASVVIHHEGRSHGRDLSKGLKSYQVKNNKKLRDRWRTVLTAEHCAPAEQIFVARDRSREKAHLLVIDHYVPQWDRDAGSRTMYNFLQSFVSRGIAVTFWSDNLLRDERYSKPLQQLGIEIIYGNEYVGKFEDWLKERAIWFRYVLLSRPHIAEKYIDAVRNTTASKIIYYGHDVHWRRLLQEHTMNGVPSLALVKRVRELERKLAHQSDVILYPSDEEKDIVESSLVVHREVISVPAWFFDANRLDDATVRIASEARSQDRKLLFVGGFAHKPNLDAILWFINEVVPILKAMNFDFRLTIAGSKAPAMLSDLCDDSIKLVGQVSDEELQELYENSDAAIVPLRVGAGVKGKVIEAFAAGVPVISTPIGVQGIPQPEEMAFVGTTPQEFANMTISAVVEKDQAVERSLKALAFVRREYTARSFMAKLSQVMPELN